MTRDRDYRQDIARLHSIDEAWLTELPLRDMVNFGWLTPAPSPADAMAACLRFFAVPSVPAWRETYAGLQSEVAFRTSRSIDSHPGAVATWLRQGQIEAEKITCGEWNPTGFRKSFEPIRRLTRLKDPRRFIPKLQQLCAPHGVAVVVVRAPTGCRASGATWFRSPEKAVLMLSFRYLTDDHFWFSFFHEAGHLLLHSKRTLFRETNLILEGMGDATTSEEKEANEFAAAALIPSAFDDELHSLGNNAFRVIRFAGKLGISPGIVVGQLQHRAILRESQLNRLKRRFSWGD